MKRFQVIPGGDRPAPGRSSTKGAVETLICSCGSSTTIEVQVGRMIEGDEVLDGTTQIVCFHCSAVLV